MGRPDCALEVFKSYPRHRIQEYQTNFRQALRAACRGADSTALDMMHFCWASYNDEYSNAKVLLDERQEYKVAIFLNRTTADASLDDGVLASTTPHSTRMPRLSYST